MEAFVMMPFASDFKEVRSAIRDSAAGANVTCVWADEMPEVGRVTDQMTSAIRRASVCIADISGRNVNVAWEMGFAHALGKPVLILAQSQSDLFFDLADQRLLLYKPQELDCLKQQLSDWLMRLIALQPSVPPEDLIGTAGHEKMSHILGGKRISDTPYKFFDLVTLAKKQIFMAAQNHFYFVEVPERAANLKETIRNFLQADSGRSFQVMLCDPTADYAIRTWQYVSAQRYERDLSRASAFFEELAEWARAKSLSKQLTIRRVPFVPISVTFVDPAERNGFLVLTPNVYEERNPVRPCFIISRTKNDDIFQQYWSAYSQRFNDPGAPR